MRALAVTPGTPKSLHARSDVPDPDRADGQALVRVLEAGVCGTDFEINDGLYGRAPEGFDYLVLGHENLGVVDAAPAGSGVASGDLVVSTVRRPCPERCAPCAADQNDMCLTGHYLERGIGGLHGFMSERYAEDPRYLIRVPPSLRQVAILLEPLSIVEKGFDHAFRMQERTAWSPRVAVVLGAGTVGVLAAACLRLRGIETFVVGREHSGTARDAFIAELGIQYVSTNEVALEALPMRVGRADIVFEATGAAAVVMPAIQLLGPDGVAILASVTGGERRFEVDVATWNRQIVLGNQLVFGTVNAGKRHFEQGVRDLETLEAKHRGWLARLITRRLPFTDLDGLLKRNPNDIKTVLEFS
jgi:threonine dehydrogenase-like Zn-dependent dehydrogenase